MFLFVVEMAASWSTTSSTAEEQMLVESYAVAVVVVSKVSVHCQLDIQSPYFKYQSGNHVIMVRLQCCTN